MIKIEKYHAVRFFKVSHKFTKLLLVGQFVKHEVKSIKL